MAITRVASSSPLVQRSCLRCGYRGEELQRLGEGTGYHCPSCGQDLYARPPRSYAEMEGLPVAPPTPPARALRTREAPPGATRPPTLLRRLLRWMGAMLGTRADQGHARARSGVEVRPGARHSRNARP